MFNRIFCALVTKVLIFSLPKIRSKLEKEPFIGYFFIYKFFLFIFFILWSTILVRANVAPYDIYITSSAQAGRRNKNCFKKTVRVLNFEFKIEITEYGGRHLKKPEEIVNEGFMFLTANFKINISECRIDFNVAWKKTDNGLLGWKGLARFVVVFYIWIGRLFLYRPPKSDLKLEGELWIWILEWRDARWIWKQWKFK